MAKSPPFKRYEVQLARVNDLLCYYLFSDSEVESNLAKLGCTDPKAYTTNTFATNPYSERLHIRTQALGKFRELAFHTSVGMSLLSAVEYLLTYISDVEEFRALVRPTAHDQLKHEKAEEQLAQKLSLWGGQLRLDNEVVKTIRYLRLRRNHIAHIRDEMTQDLKDLIKNDSHYLNRYWASQPTKIFEFDFSKPDHSIFSPDEALALVNLTRVCIKKVDTCIMASFGRLDIANFEAKEFLSNPDHKHLNELRLSRKFRALLRHKYGRGAECLDADFRAIAGYT